MIATTIDLGSFRIMNEQYADDTLTIPANTTIKVGTILARDSSTLKLVPFVKGGTTNENGIPKCIAASEVTNATGSPVDSTSYRYFTAGTVNLQRLIIQADGNANNIDKKVIDQLRDYTILTEPVRNLSVLDNL